MKDISGTPSDKELKYVAKCAYCDVKSSTEKSMRHHLITRHNVSKDEIKVIESNVLEIYA